MMKFEIAATHSHWDANVLNHIDIQLADWASRSVEEMTAFNATLPKWAQRKNLTISSRDGDFGYMSWRKDLRPNQSNEGRNETGIKFMLKLEALLISLGHEVTYNASKYGNSMTEEAYRNI